MFEMLYIIIKKSKIQSHSRMTFNIHGTHKMGLRNRKTSDKKTLTDDITLIDRIFSYKYNKKGAI